MSYPHRVLDSWEKRELVDTYERNGEHWWDRNLEFEVKKYRVTKYERWEYINPNNQNTYEETVEVDSWYEYDERPLNDLN
jgi:hypothetical protein